jgi:bifunctional non-homologous end joining protein LigD
MALEEYKKKRDFKHTPEPGGKKNDASGNKIFVVQRHDASRLHYDFRLEMDGVLKSWAVPKGPSLNPSDKRLAVMVEDHPYAYRTFEGTIPKGNYGAGEVQIWDERTYEPLHRQDGKNDDETLLAELAKGSLKIILHGQKLKGEFALVKMHTAKEENAWLLIKHDDHHAVHTPYDVEDHLIPDSHTSHADRLITKDHNQSGSTPSPKIKPMLAKPGGKPFDDKEWIFEIKWDGYRAVADLSEGVQFYSRNGQSYLGKYPVIEAGLRKQPQKMILDGEIVTYDRQGIPDFQLLQHYAEKRKAPITYQVFDLLFLNGHSTRELPLIKRKELLKEALLETPHVKYCDHVDGAGREFFKVIQGEKIEGIMAKKKSSIYIEGHRTSEWIKIKDHQTDEAIIAGYTEPRGSRKYFGSLVLATYKNGTLRYAGHAGTGFSEKLLKEIHTALQPLVTRVMPFSTTPPTNMPPTWVEPVTVCTIKYTEKTEEGLFRHPVFIGIREDKTVEDLYQESLKQSSDSSTVKPDAKSKASSDSKHTPGRKTTEVPEPTYTNLDKLYWKKEKITKGELIDYYLSVSDFLLPYLKGRAQSLHRFPNGIEESGFYHKDAGDTAPSWVDTVSIYSESTDKNVEYIVCNNRETLGYLINLGCIELNPWNNRIDFPDKPDYLIIDLDPSEKNSFRQVVEAAKVTKEVLDATGVTAFCKTSGSTGLHIFIPMGAQYTYEQVRDFALILMQMVQKRLPKTTTLERSLKKRGPKIYLDYLQNRMGQTVASVYSIRPKSGAPVSMSIEWEELTQDLAIGDFTIHNALIRLQKKGDLFLPVLEKGIDLMPVLNRLEEMQ